jgi:hypothetical protein
MHLSERAVPDRSGNCGNDEVEARKRGITRRLSGKYLLYLLTDDDGKAILGTG